MSTTVSEHTTSLLATSVDTSKPRMWAYIPNSVSTGGHTGSDHIPISR